MQIYHIESHDINPRKQTITKIKLFDFKRYFVPKYKPMLCIYVPVQLIVSDYNMRDNTIN